MLYFQPTKLIALGLLAIVGCTPAAAEECWIDPSNWSSDGRRVKGEMVYDRRGKNGICVRNDPKPPRPYVKDTGQNDVILVPEKRPVKLRMKPKAAAVACPPTQVRAPSGECVAAGQCRSGYVLSSSTGRCIQNACRPGNVVSSTTGRCVPAR